MNPSHKRPRFLDEFKTFRGRIRERNFAVWDIETSDGTLLGPTGGIAATTSKDYPALMTFRPFKKNVPPVAFLNWALKKRYRGFIFMAHKALSFDLTHLLSNKQIHKWLSEKKVTATVTQSFVTFRHGKHSWSFGDSIRLFHEALDKVLKTFAPDHTKSKLPSSPFSWSDSDWRARILGDVRGLFCALIELDKIIRKTFHVNMGLTMPSTALRAARYMMPDNLHIPRPPRLILDWLRTGVYTGGRIEVFWQGEFNDPVSILDINSAYAWAMLQPFPIGDGSYMHKEPSRGEYFVALCKVHVPPMFIPPINDKLSGHTFSTGNYITILTKEEVTFARSNSVSVDVIEGWVWSDQEPLFRPFIETCRELRFKDYDGPLGKAVKLAQNGLYGILGMNPFRHDYLMSIEDPEPPWLPTMDIDTGEESRLIYERISYKESIAQMPHWAAIITARVRIRLTSFMLQLQRLGATPLYTHTDSIWVPSSVLQHADIQREISTEYGALKHEAEGRRAIIVAPGEAALERPTSWRISSKGFRAKAEDFLKAEPHTIEQTQVFRVTTGVKRQSVGRIIRKRIGDYTAIRNRHAALTRPGVTKPIDIQQDCNSVRKDWSILQWHIGKHQKIVGMSHVS